MANNKSKGPKFRDLTGLVFGRLTVLRLSDKPAKGAVWVCSCSCGGGKEVRSGFLNAGLVKSCGCLGREKSEKAISHLAELRTYSNMKDRCYNPRNAAYARYGGRGIAVCERWRESFRAFLADVGRRPSPQHTLDRINNDGPYSPENCRWATRKQQQRNRSVNRVIEWQGERLTVAEWAERLGMSSRTIIGRIDALGWSPEKALTTSVEREGGKYGWTVQPKRKGPTTPAEVIDEAQARAGALTL